MKNTICFTNGMTLLWNLWRVSNQINSNFKVVLEGFPNQYFNRSVIGRISLNLFLNIGWKRSEPSINLKTLLRLSVSINDILGYTAKKCSSLRGSFTCIEGQFILSRQYGFYFFHYFIPTTLIVMLRYARLFDNWFEAYTFESIILLPSIC